MELKKEDFISLRQELLNIVDESIKSRLILTGDKPILLTTTIFIDSDSEEYKSNFYKFFKDNGIHNSLLDSFIYLIYRIYGVYGVVDYVPMSDARKDMLSYKQVRRYYYDKEFKKLLEDAKIDSIYSLNYGRFIANSAVDHFGIHELNSSFSFMGLTGVSKGLTDILDEYEIQYHSMYGGGIDNEEFKRLKLFFTDDTIKYNHLLKIGKIRNRELDRKNMWPRMLDISINDNISLNEFYKLFIEYLEWALSELQTKGTYDAMSPMRKLGK